MPASVYVTVSRSGQTYIPRCTKSSPVLTMTVRRSGPSTAARPSTSFAPPTPPASTRTFGNEGAGACIVERRSGVEIGLRIAEELLRARLRRRELQPAHENEGTRFICLTGDEVRSGCDL